MAALAIDASSVNIVDWLEFTAFFDFDYGQARLDEVIGTLSVQEEDTEENIAERDAEAERIRESIEAEINARANFLGEAYPFVLSSDGEVLSFKTGQARRGRSLYLFCLILSHVKGSPILRVPPEDGSVRDVRRRHFQVFATFAVAGHIGGPALSLGWPRASGESILGVVTRACMFSGTGQAREIPALTANPSAKDGGIDVLGWRPSFDRPPPSSFWFAQAASGLNWRGKSAKDEHEDFERDYFDIPPQCNPSFVTISPLRVDDATMESKSRRHGTILDRTRAPLAALKGLRLAKNGTLVDEVQRACILPLWIGRYRAAVRQGA